MTPSTPAELPAALPATSMDLLSRPAAMQIAPGGQSSRTSSGLHLVNSGSAAPLPPVLKGVFARFRGLFRAGVDESGSPRAPHPGDILYWITCVGAACLLLLAAT